MNILSGLANVQATQTSRTPSSRPPAPAAPPSETPRSARTPESGRNVAPAGPDRPHAVADGHRVERPIPREAHRPAPRGSVVDIMV
jgi:hypothetical protein